MKSNLFVRNPRCWHEVGVRCCGTNPLCLINEFCPSCSDSLFPYSEGPSVRMSDGTISWSKYQSFKVLPIILIRNSVWCEQRYEFIYPCKQFDNPVRTNLTNTWRYCKLAKRATERMELPLREFYLAVCCPFESGELQAFYALLRVCTLHVIWIWEWYFDMT